MDNRIDLVVARYKEDVSWVFSIPNNINAIVYNKFYKEDETANNITLPNVGREAHTYLYHIVKNFDKLSEHTIFSQGNPFDHSPKFLQEISKNIEENNELSNNGFYSLGKIILEGPYANIDYRHECGLPIFYFFDLLFDITMKPKDTYQTSYGAQFIVNKTNITHRPIEFYSFLLSFFSTESNPIEGYIIERLWPYIFNIKIPLSKRLTRILQ